MFRVVVSSGLRLQGLRVWFLPVLYVSQVLLGSLQLLDHFRVIIYPTIHRVALTE